MSLIKYRLREVAADFGVTPKEIAEIISKFYEKPKSNTQVLTGEELNVVFDYMTQKNQIQSLEQVFAVKPKEAPKPEQPKAAPEQNKPAQQQGRQPQNQQGRQNQQNRQGQNQPQNQNRQQPQQAAPAPVKPAEPERKRERRVVDTSAVQVNASRFEDVDNLVSERVQNFEGGKQRIGGG